jgi:mannosyl-oligosaccharide alpha-1,3-glucosidase
MNEPSVFEAEQ